LLLALTLMTLQLSVAAPRAQAANNIIITGVNLTNLQIVNGVLKAGGTVTGTLAGFPFTTDITNFALSVIPDNPTMAVECSVLNLALAPIHLSVLGLHVDTSAICLTITATQGGGLLGDLLCSLAGGGILPTAGQLTDLVSGLLSILNGALAELNNPPGGGGGRGGGGGSGAGVAGSAVCTGQCEILDLVIGPLNLSLLGLNVILNNCTTNGPVEVCVSATASEGLLGQLLCRLTSPQLLNLSLADITQLVTTALASLADGVLSPTEAAALRALLFQLALR